MKKLILSLLCALPFATQCELPENWKETLRRFDKQAGHAVAIGTTIVSSGFAAATGTTTIAAVVPVVVGVAVIAAHSARMNYNKKLAEQQKSLEEKPLTDAIEKGASQLPH